MEGVINTTGRRKTSVARLYMSDGKGKILVNNRELEDYFPAKRYRYIVMQPLELLESVDKFDIKVTVAGGGETGQSGAIRLAISRALVEIDAENKSALRKAGFMTRDPRVKERKKPGQPSARKQFQFSKR